MCFFFCVCGGGGSDPILSKKKRLFFGADFFWYVVLKTLKVMVPEDASAEDIIMHRESGGLYQVHGMKGWVR